MQVLDTLNFTPHTQLTQISLEHSLNKQHNGVTQHVKTKRLKKKQKKNKTQQNEITAKNYGLYSLEFPSL